MLPFFKSHITKFPSTYIDNGLLEDLLLIIDTSKVVDTHLIDEVMQVLTSVKADPRRLIAKAGEQSNVKALIIENLGAQDPGDKQYLAEYYIVKLQRNMQENDLWDLIAEFLTSYTRDMTYTKCSVNDFLMIKINHNEKFKDFSKYLQDVKSLYEMNQDGSLLNNIVKQLESFDIGHTLALLFLGTHDLLRRFFTKDELFEIFMTCNDFLNTDMYLDDNNIIKVFEHYVSLSRRQISNSLISHLLERNQRLLRNQKTLLNILSQIPNDSDFETLFNPIFCIIRNIESREIDLSLKKSLLKDEICIHKSLLNKLNKDKQS